MEKSRKFQSICIVLWIYLMMPNVLSAQQANPDWVTWMTSSDEYWPPYGGVDMAVRKDGGMITLRRDLSGID